MAKRRNDLSSASGDYLLVLTCMVALVLSAAVILPGVTYIRTMAHDTFSFVDVAYRINLGQRPHLDFHAPMGALTYVLPYLGLKISGSYGLALPVAGVVTGLLLAVLGFLSLRVRLSKASVSLVLLLVLVLSIVPVNTGDDPRYITYAMFYNRFGWCALLIVFLHVLPRSDGRLTGPEDLILGVLLVFLFYTKITYWLAALAFVGLMGGLLKERRRGLLIALGVLLLAVGLVEILTPGLHAGYFADVARSIESRGAIQRTPLQLLHRVMVNSVELAIGTIALVLAWRQGTRSGVLLLLGYVFLASFAMLDQSSQMVGVVSLVALPLWALEGTSTGDVGAGRMDSGVTWNNRVTAAVLLALFLIPYYVRGAASVYYQIRGATADEFIIPGNRELARFRVYSDPGFVSQVELMARSESLSNSEFYRIRSSMRPQPLFQREYVETIAAGIALIDTYARPEETVFVFDAANPFSFLTGRPPPRGTQMTVFAGSNLSIDANFAPSVLFTDVDLVMIPHYPVAHESRDLLRVLYWGYVTQNYEEVVHNGLWSLLRRRTPRLE